MMSLLSMLYQLCLPSWDSDSPVVVGAMAVSPGEKVWVGRPLMNIAFIDDKTVKEIDCPVQGMVKAIFVNSGDEVIAGQLVMEIEIEEVRESTSE